MKCSLKDGFVILLIFFFTLSEGKGYPLFLYKRSIADRSINFNDLSAMSRVEQSLDSFPKLGDFNKNSHKIVKKQMTASDYKHTQKNKRSTFSFQESLNIEDDLMRQCREKSEQAIANSSSNDNCIKEKSALNLKRRRVLGIETKFFDRLAKGDIFPRGIPSKKQKHKKIYDDKKQENEKEIQKMVEKEIETALDKTEKSLEKTQSVLENTTEMLTSEKQNKKANAQAAEKANAQAAEKANAQAAEKANAQAAEKANAQATEKANAQAAEKANAQAAEKANAQAAEKTSKNALQTENKKDLERANANAMETKKSEEILKEPTVSFDYKNFKLNDTDIKEEYKALRNMVGCNMGKFCRFPDVQNSHNYFECESDENGCIKLKYKNCPNGEIFSSKFLECVKPFFWKLVERQKRSLWKKEKKQQYSNNWDSGQSANAWTDATHEEGRQFPSEIRAKCKPELVVYHLKVKKSVNEDFQRGKKKQRHILRTPNLAHTEISRRLTPKVANFKREEHQLFPRSFIICINKKEGGKSDHEESVSEDEPDEAEDNGDEEDDDEDDEEIKDDEETNDEEEDTEDDDEDKKPVEKSGIKEFLKSAKEAITNKAKFNEPADTSFTLDKTNSYTKNKKLDGSEKDSKKVLIDADIKVDKSLGKTLKRILGKRKDDNVSSEGNVVNDRGSQDLMGSEQITKYENLIRSNPRLKRYFLVSLGEKEN